MHLVVQRQRVIAGAPIVADARLAVDDQRVHSGRTQPRGYGQPGLPGAHHDHGRVVRVVYGGTAAAVEPVLATEAARVIRLGVARRRMQRVQRGDDRPGPHGAWPGDQAHNARSSAVSGLERDQRLDHLRSSPDHAPRRRPSRCQADRAGLRQGAGNQALDCGRARHGRDFPRQRQHVPPVPIRLEQRCNPVAASPSASAAPNAPSHANRDRFSGRVRHRCLPGRRYSVRRSDAPKTTPASG